MTWREKKRWLIATVVIPLCICAGAVLLSPGQYWKPVKQEHNFGANPFQPDIAITTAADVQLIREGGGLLLQWRSAGTFWWPQYEHSVRCQWLTGQWPKNWPPETLVGINFNENWKVTKVTTPVGVVCQ
mgnify:CR=1 FL=1